MGGFLRDALSGSRIIRRSCLALALALGGCGGDVPGNIEIGMSPAGPASVKLVRAYPSLAAFSKPLFFTHAPGDSQRVFVVTQPGIIYVFNNDPNVSTAKVFLDISARVTDDGGEQGLLGLAFDPNYPSNGFLYLNYNPNFDNTGANPRRTAISRFTVSSNPDAADPASEAVLLSYPQPFANHKGGWLDIGPDGKLYIATGDGGSGGDPNNNAQSLNTLLGKILRIGTDGTVPADNPFAPQLSARGEIWAYGFRNPYRAAFDRNSGELWVGDVGQNQWEEIDLVSAGGNYGWRKFEGKHVFNAADPDPGNTLLPLLEYDHSGGRCSVIGGYVYRGGAIGALRGVYLYADYCSGELWGLTRAMGTASSTLLGDVPGNPTSFGEDAAGEIYVTSFDGNIYKIVPN